MNNKTEKFINLFGACIICMMVLVGGIGVICIGVDAYCIIKGPAYELDNICHDPNLRCSVECQSNHLNFTGVFDGCNCLCSENYTVSVCSGLKKYVGINEVQKK